MIETAPLQTERREHRLSLLREALRDPDPSVRAAAARAMERLERKSDLPALTARLQSTVVRDRIEAVYALGELAEAEALPLLVAALNDTVEDVRTAALRSLAQVGDTSALSPIIQCLDDPNPLIVRHALEALGRFRDPRLVPVLLAVLQDTEDAVTLASALGALASCGGQSTERSLLPYLGHDDASVRIAVVDALGALD